MSTFSSTTEGEPTASESNAVFDEPKKQSTSQSSQQPRFSNDKELVRTKNYEESMPFLCNFFYCFYFYFICKIDPITEVDIPKIAKKDATKINTDNLRENWDPACRKYLADLKEYDNAKKENPEFVSIFSSCGD